MSKLQQVRGFAANDLGVGAPGVTGVSLATMGGIGNTLAAMAPTDSAPGILAFQPKDKDSQLADIVTIGYGTVGGVLAAIGQPEPLLELATNDDRVSLVTDDSGRLWVGLPDAACRETTEIFVLDRK